MNYKKIATYSCHGWEFEERLLDTAIVIHMDGVFEHEVYEVGVRLDEVVQILQILQLASLLLVKDVKVVLRGVQFHVFDLLGQIGLLL